MIERILAEVDAEIARLKEARALLSPPTATPEHRPRRKRSKMSKAARAKIAAAQRERWKRQKANASKKA